MKTILVTILIVSLALPTRAALYVVDWANLEQAVHQVMFAKQQAESMADELRRMGDPAAVQRLSGAVMTLAELVQPGLGQSLADLQRRTTGQGGILYDGGGLYPRVESEIPLSNGQTLPRSAEAYRKYEALQQAVANYHAVVADTRARLAALRQAQRETSEQLGAAQSDAETQKLKGVLASQESALGGLAAERAEATANVLVQQAANEADRARQAQADTETRAAGLQSALQNAFRLFKADSRPTMIQPPTAVAR